MAHLTDIGLVLLGHGSASDPSTALPVWECAERLGPRFRDVRVAFWKEAPQPHEVLESVDAHDVVILPFLMSDGWFGRTAFPRALGVADEDRDHPVERGPRRLVYTRPIGTSDGWVDVALAATATGRRRFGAAAHVVVVAHGTPRDLRSTESAHALAASLVERGVRATARFIEPGVPGALSADNTLADGAVVLPYFVGEGPHVTDDLRAVLGLPPGAPCGEYRVNGARLQLGTAIGRSPAIDALVTAVAGEAATRFAARPAPEMTPVEERLAAVRQALDDGPVTLGGVVVRRDGGGFRVHAASDAAATENRPRSGAYRWARFDDAGDYRPWLNAWGDRPTGWHVRADGLGELLDVLETVAPGALALWRGGPGAAEWSTVARRSAGRRRRAAGLPPADVVRLADRICGPCVRLPSWRAEATGAAVGDMRERGLRCPTPCGRVLDAGAATVGERD